MAVEKARPDKNSAGHLYFAVPLSGNSNEFSGQYLRLREYIGPDEDSHLPESVSNSDLSGITLSANGLFLLNADLKMAETFGEGLTEKILDGDHKLTVDKGDWTLEAEDGSITIEAKGTSPDATITLESGGSDLHVHSWLGKAATSDSRDIKESDSKKVTYVQLFEYSSVLGASITQRTAFSMSINVIGDSYVKFAEIKATVSSLKIILKKYTGYCVSINLFQVLSFKLAANYRKTMILYNKMTVQQIYVELLKKQNDIVKNQIKTGVTKDYAAAMRKKMLGAKLYQFFKF